MTGQDYDQEVTTLINLLKQKSIITHFIFIKTFANR